jgi:hypothetical protein
MNRRRPTSVVGAIWTIVLVGGIGLGIGNLFLRYLSDRFLFHRGLTLASVVREAPFMFVVGIVLGAAALVVERKWAPRPEPESRSADRI